MPLSKSTGTRRKHTNLRLGCLNCKRKKIRCDENLPQCENCLRAKKEFCSYLNMSQVDINRIRLTHSLRNSQNKLLSRDYRLPISTNHFFGNSNDEKVETLVATANTLEFQFEYCHFRKPFPKVPYLAFQFHNTFRDSYRLGYDSDEEMVSLNGASADEVSLRGLPNCRLLESSFNRLDYDYYKRKLKNLSLAQQHSMMLFMERLRINGPFAELFIDANILFGRALVLHGRKQSLEVFPDPEVDSQVVLLEAKSIQDSNSVFSRLLEHMGFHLLSIEADAPIRELQFQYGALSFASWNCTAVLLLLNFPRTVVAQTINERCKIFNKFMVKVSSTELSKTPLVTEFSRFARYGLLFIHIPLYEPAFLFEIRNNLRTLESVLDEGLMMFQNDNKSMRQLHKVRYCFSNLTSFLDNFVLQVIYSSRNELFVTTYPPNMLLAALQRWWTICPTELVCGGTVNQYPGFLDDVRNTLFLYFQALSIALDSVWPAAKYLYTLGFQWICTGDGIGKSELHPNYDYYRTDYVLPDRELAEFLWRHNVYSIRLWAFFTKRFKLYQDNTTFRCPYPETLPNSQYGSRSIKNSLEIPIRNFNTQAIKPHNYAKKIHSHYDLLLKDSSVCAIFTRDDEVQEARVSDEPVDIFNMSRPLNFSATTFFFDLDYIYKDVPPVHDDKLDNAVRSQYFEDRIRFLSEVL